MLMMIQFDWLHQYHQLVDFLQHLLLKMQPVFYHELIDELVLLIPQVVVVVWLLYHEVSILI
jgi:hypothetical protein